MGFGPLSCVIMTSSGEPMRSIHLKMSISLLAVGLSLPYPHPPIRASKISSLLAESVQCPHEATGGRPPLHAPAGSPKRLLSL